MHPPLLRSEDKLQSAISKLLKLAGEHVTMMSGTFITDTGENLLQHAGLIGAALRAAVRRAQNEHAPLIGSVQDPLLVSTVFNTIVADSLILILDEIGSVAGDQTPTQGDYLPILNKPYKEPPHFKSRFDAFGQFLERKTVAAFEDVLSEEELQNLYESLVKEYVTTMQEEAGKYAELEKLLEQIADMGWEGKGKVFAELIEPKMRELRGK